MEFMRGALKDTPIGEYRQPPDIRVLNVSPSTGEYQENGIPEFFQENHLPPGTPQPEPETPEETPPEADLSDPNAVGAGQNP